MFKKTISGVAAAFALSAGAASATPVDFLDLGNIGLADTYTFGTVGSIFTEGNLGRVDTELAIWSADGTLLDNDDDGGPGLFSEISINLADGTYFLGITEWNATFANDFVVNCAGCFESGEVADLALNIDGTLAGTLSAGFDSPQETAFFRIEVGEITPVPLPAGLPLLASGFALFGVMRHKRKAS